MPTPSLTPDVIAEIVGILEREETRLRRLVVEALEASRLDDAAGAIEALRALGRVRDEVERLVGLPSLTGEDREDQVITMALVQGDATEPEPTPTKPEPEPAVADSASEATNQPAPTPPPPPEAQSSRTSAMQRTKNKEIGKRRTHFFAAVRGWELDADVSEAQVKALICFGRGCLAEADDLSRDQVLDEVRRTISLWNQRSEEPEFFGCNLSRAHRPEIWFDLAEAYRLLDAAERTRAFLEAEEELDEASRRPLIDRAAAAETIIFRLNVDHALGVRDKQQERLHQWLSNLGVPVEWWRDSRNEGPSTKAVRDAALELDELLSKAAKKVSCARALTGLKQLEDEPIDARFIDVMADCLEECLEAGVRPTDRTLVNTAIPYCHSLQELGRPTLSALLKHAEQQLNRIAKKVPVESFDGESDEEPTPEVQQLRDVLAGKTVAFIGGNKGQQRRKQEIVEVFGLQDLIWPDTEEHTKSKVLRDAVSKADVVVQLIRWSRHSFKDVLDHAKSKGKRTAVLKGGLGINRIAHDLLAQLAQPPAP